MERESVSGTGVQITLRYIVGSQESIIKVDHFPFLIGRDSASVQLALPDATVSRVHARLICQDGAVLLENISTTNKTAVNGRVISAPTELNSGDRAVMGSSQLVFEIDCSVESGKVSDLLEDESKIGGVIAAQITSDENDAGNTERTFPPQYRIVSEPKQVSASESTEPHRSYCWKCGKKLDSDSTFCRGCGTAVTTEITGQPKFCENCGEKLSWDACFCPYCGKSAIWEKPSVARTPLGASTAPKNVQKSKKTGIKNLIPVIAASVVFIAAIVTGVLLFGERSYTKVVNQYVEAMLQCDVKGLWNLYPDEMHTFFLDYDDADTIQEVLTDLKNTLDDFHDELEDEIGEIRTYSYEIIDEADYTRGEIIDLKKQLRDNLRIQDIEIDAAKGVLVEVTVEGKYDSFSFTRSFVVVKIGRTWYLLS